MIKIKKKAKNHFDPFSSHPLSVRKKEYFRFGIRIVYLTIHSKIYTSAQNSDLKTIFEMNLIMLVMELTKVIIAIEIVYSILIKPSSRTDIGFAGLRRHYIQGGNLFLLNLSTMGIPYDKLDQLSSSGVIGRHFNYVTINQMVPIEISELEGISN
ncbi:hypothetical protein LOAG_02768 [Loa loa]|uniref:Uncharacterized protein n=1 Tax=Loa loa TaxID=7209 RepID=A0A1S0U693_LOALO|nr:hypothetical protein LOAG_02768 [Loa loa]EFO25712.1 hypothetical protein LOAG_02768 [Loa loa]